MICISLAIGLIALFAGMIDVSATDTTFNKISFAPDKSSFFPLIPGSCWTYQDSSFTAEGEQIVAEDLALESRTVFTDSIIDLIKKPEGWYSNALSFIGKKDKKTARIQYFVDNKGFIYKGMYTIKGFERRKLPIAKTFPAPGDTVFEDGWDKDRPLICSMNGDTCVLSTPISIENPTKIKFVRGIGQVGRAFGYASAKNLIKYHIGRGPATKKHWHMEMPEKK